MTIFESAALSLANFEESLRGLSSSVAESDIESVKAHADRLHVRLSRETCSAQALWSRAIALRHDLERMKIRFETSLTDADVDDEDAAQRLWAKFAELTERLNSANDALNARYHRALFADLGVPSPTTTPSP